MKENNAVTEAHYSDLKELIERNSIIELLKYKEGLKNDSRVYDIDKAFRWDVLYFSKPRQLLTSIYEYTDTANIDTALQTIFSGLGL